MTPQEALEIITNAVQTDKMTAEQDKALAIAQKALEKQIPKKPIKEKYGVCKCPACNDLEVKDYTTGVKFRHCRYCGQALDWGNTK